MNHSKPPRLFRNNVAAVVQALHQIFHEEKYADQVVSNILKSNRKWGSRDRHFIADTSYNIVRYWIYYLALYQKELENTEEELWSIFGIYWLDRGYELPDWNEFEKIDRESISQKKENVNSFRELESYPIWFHQRAEEELGEAWLKIGNALNVSAPIGIRANNRFASVSDLISELSESGIKSIVKGALPHSLYISDRANIKSLTSFKKGNFEIQDIGSQEIGLFTNPQPGETIIDACAGAGGKTLQLADLMNNKGTIISMDVVPEKLSELEKRAKRNKVTICETLLLENSNTIEPFDQKADKLLLDAPCSGSGVIKRQPDTKWKLTNETVDQSIALQRSILDQYSTMVKKGGELIYATCSIFKSENEDQTSWFLEEFKNFELIEEKRLDPSDINDGFYMAKFKRIS